MPEEKLRQAATASMQLRTARTKADTLLPEDHHYQACCLEACLLQAGQINARCRYHLTLHGHPAGKLADGALP